MQLEIDSSHINKDAYDQAISDHSQYVMDDEFRLKFLRANYFDARKAAKNFIKYLGLLQKYYGDEALMRPLHFSDLGKGELELLRTGHMNLISQRDRSGRRVLNVFGSYRKEHTVFSKVSFECSISKRLMHVSLYPHSPIYINLLHDFCRSNWLSLSMV
jgi:hypothetical protein